MFARLYGIEIVVKYNDLYDVQSWLEKFGGLGDKVFNEREREREERERGGGGKVNAC
jgi:hypothetical protein